MKRKYDKISVKSNLGLTKFRRFIDNMQAGRVVP